MNPIHQLFFRHQKALNQESSPSRTVALLFENLPQIISLFKEGPSGWTAAGEAIAVAQISALCFERFEALCNSRTLKDAVQVHLPEAGASLSFFGEDPQRRVSKV